MFAGDCATLCANRCWHVCYRAAIVAGHIWVPPIWVHVVYRLVMAQRFPRHIPCHPCAMNETGMTMGITTTDDRMTARYAGYDYRMTYGYEARMADIATVAPYAAMAARLAADESDGGY